MVLFYSDHPPDLWPISLSVFPRLPIQQLVVTDTADHVDTIVASDTNNTDDWSVLWEGEQVL